MNQLDQRNKRQSSIFALLIVLSVAAAAYFFLKKTPVSITAPSDMGNAGNPGDVVSPLSIKTPPAGSSTATTPGVLPGTGGGASQTTTTTKTTR